MRINRVFKTEEEYLEFVKNFLETDPTGSIWKPEDRAILDPLFQYLENPAYMPYIDLTEPERRGLSEHYLKCCADYADESAELNQILRGFEYYDGRLLDFFFVIPLLDEDDNGVKLELDLDKITEFPFAFVGTLESGSDRLGSLEILVSDVVYLRQFSE
jgi:hypothetical protein